MESKAPKLLLRAMFGNALTAETFARVLPRVLKDLQGAARFKLAWHALHCFLRERFGGDEIDLITSLLSAMGDGLDGAWFARRGLGRDVDGATASRNMVCLSRATQPARLRAAWAIEDIARTLVQRPSLDLDAAAVEVCAALMLDAEKVAPKAFLSAAGHLLPVLLRSRDRPVSPMIVVAFPSVHRELARYDDVPDLFKFIPFFDWDRCKAARHELVDAFMSSSWPPSDLALAACRTREVSKILQRVPNPLSFRVQDERDLMDYWFARDSEGVPVGVLYTIERSPYRDEFHATISGQTNAFQHYLIAGDDLCVEVLSALPPRLPAGWVTEASMDGLYERHRGV